MNAGELCNRDVVTITRDAGIIDAAKLMRDPPAEMLEDR